MTDIPSWATDEKNPVTVPAWASDGGSSTPAWASAEPQPKVVAPDDKSTDWRLQQSRAVLQGGAKSADAAAGAYMESAENGFGGLVSRKFDEATGYRFTPWSADKLDEKDPETRKALQKAYENANIRATRQKYSKQANQPGANPALNFVAGAAGAADPTWLTPLPELGFAGKGAEAVASRIASRAAANAALMSGSDAAYQIADEIDGVKKDFDIKRNLESAAFGAAFGGVHSAATEVSPFIVDLFKQRSVDTTPSSNPAGKTTPLTGQGLSPEEHAQYQELLKTGDVNDIRGFFDDRNATPPSFAATHEWVSRRDAVNEGHAAPDYADDMFKPEAPVTDQRSAVHEHIVNETSNWKNAPDFEVINHVDDIQDPQVRDAAKAEGADHPDALGFLGNDGKVRIFANRIDSPDTLNAVLYHEALGHHGLAQQFGEKLDGTLQTLMDRNVGQFGKDVDEWQKKNPGAYNGDRVRAAEEVLANMSNNGVIKPSVTDALTAHVRNFGRKMGLKLGYSDGEIRTILGMAHDAVINGKGRDVTGNGFKFMKSGDGESEKPLPFTQADVIRNRRIRGELKHDGNLDQHLDPNYKNTLEDRLGREYGDVPNEVIDNVHNTWREGRTPNLAKEVNVYDNRTGEVIKTLPDRHHAMKYIDTHPDSDHLGIDRLGTDAKFMRRSDLAPKDVAEEAYERLGRDYTPKTRSWDEAREMAKDSALDPSKVMASRSVGNLDKKLHIYNNAANELNTKLTALAKKAETEGLTDEEHVEGMKAAADFSYVLGRLENDAAQIARGLNAMKAISFSRNNLLALRDALEKGETNMDALADRDTMIKFLKQYNAMSAKGNPNGAANLARGVTQPYWWQYLLTWRNNMMLSGLSTHLKSTMDMATTAGRDLEEKIASLGAAPVRALAQNLGVKVRVKDPKTGAISYQPVKDGTHPAEVAMHLWGVTKAVLDAQTYKDTADAFVHGGTQRFGTPGAANPRIPGVSKVTDAIAAQDTFFRSVLINQNLYALGARKAHADLKAMGKASWDDITTIGSNHARNPSPEMLAEATHLAENTMLLNKSELNSGIDTLKKIRPGMSGMEQVGKFVINYLTPFIRVQSNALMNQIIRRSPLSFLDSVTRADWAAGGSRRDVAIMRTLIGTVILANAWNAADPKKDKLTGEGPLSLAKLKELQASGWSADSVHENGRYNKNSNLNISLNPFDLHNNTASLVAGVRGAYEEGKNAKDLVTGLKLASAAVMHDLVSQTFINDIGEAYDAFSAKGQTLLDRSGKFVQNEAKSFLPNVTTQAAKIIDPNAHDTSESFADNVKASIPFASNGVPIKYNVYGQPMKTGTSPTGIHTWVSNGNGQNETTDPTEKELNRLAKLTPAAIITATKKTIDIEGVPLKLSARQAEDYQMHTGQTIVRAIQESMESGEWAKMSDEDKIDEIRSVEKQAKSEVKDALLEQKDWLTPEQIDSVRRAQLNGQQ